MRWILAVVGALVCLPAGAAAQSTPEILGAWKGENPFNCLNQDVGMGTAFPEPAADPFCVEFDKTEQNVTEFGIADFLANEPARVAAAAPKCFYFQHDHWTGSIVQGQDPEIWNWDGSYFFDRAKGIGGAFLTNFRIGGVPVDMTPYAPPEYQPYLEPTGGGGVIVELETDPDPACGARVDTEAERRAVYRGEPLELSCIRPGGQIESRSIGKIRLGMNQPQVTRLIGEPDTSKGPIASWCVVGGAELRVLYGEGRGDKGNRGADSRVALIRTTNRGHETRRVSPGSPRKRAVRKLSLERRDRIGDLKVLAGPRPGSTEVLAGIKRGRVEWLALSDPRKLPGEKQVRAALGG